VSFNTTRTACCGTEEEAVRHAIASVEAELESMSLQNAAARPTIEVTKKARITARKARRIPSAGFTFIRILPD
jgi:hypothetical protein